MHVTTQPESERDHEASERNSAAVGYAIQPAVGYTIHQAVLADYLANVAAAFAAVDLAPL